MTLDGAPLLLSLDAPGSLALLGGKAHNLGVMRRAGLPVPEGHTLTTAAYRAFVAENGLDGLIAACWERARAGGPEALERASATLRAAFEAGRVPEAVARALAGLGEGPFAVRSSATAEDLPDASFAGQQDTYLNVRGPAVLDAARRCWGSLWTARAMAYRARQGIDPAEVALAVVIQRMVPARAAGVLFTLHPVTGASDQVMINATWGLGEALVSGRVNPDSVLADKPTGRALKVELGDKAVMTATTEGGTAEREVPAARRAERALDDAAIAGLVAHGRALEALFGGPQDVEWAIAEDGGLWLVQSRAVTTEVAVPGDDAWAPTTRAEPWPFDFWTQQDMGERWPDPVTPLTWSVCEPMNQSIMDGMFPGLKAEFAGRVQWSRRAFGRVYMNEGALFHAYAHGYGMPIGMMESSLTHPGARPKGAEGWQLGKVLRHLPFFWGAAVGWEKNVAFFEAEFPRIDALVDAAMREDWSSRADAELLEEALGTWMGHVTHYVAFHSNATALSMSAYTELEGLMGRWMGDRTLVQPLAGGLSGVIATEMVPALDALAEALRRAGLVELATTLPPAEALAALRAEPRAGEFLAALQVFLARHGHRCMVEAELRHPRWVEAPEQVVEQVASLLRTPGRGVGTAAAAARREEATAMVEAKIGFFRRPAFRRALGRLHHFTRMRDNGQHYVVKLLLPVRHLLALLGQRFAARGWIASPDDVFFLVVEELREAAAGRPGALQARADARRRAHAHWCARPAPEVLDALGQPVAPVLEDAGPDTLVGLGASRGVVTGRARVVASPAEAARLEPGDILVTRATDPGWTPVFNVIGGAVLEIGGMLSHGAIVAREYGLPAVVNVPDATRRIVDGQTLTVDGGTGRVTVG